MGRGKGLWIFRSQARGLLDSILISSIQKRMYPRPDQICSYSTFALKVPVELAVFPASSDDVGGVLAFLQAPHNFYTSPKHSTTNNHALPVSRVARALSLSARHLRSSQSLPFEVATARA
jgi:hypothetical protein